jgi:hypothetical protein
VVGGVLFCFVLFWQAAGSLLEPFPTLASVAALIHVGSRVQTLQGAIVAVAADRAGQGRAGRTQQTIIMCLKAWASSSLTHSTVGFC